MKDSKLKKILLKNAFPLFGLGALIWFLIRVIPKPSRASYPCMRVAAPMASSFVLWLLSLSSTILIHKHIKKNIAKSNYFKTAILVSVMLIAILINLNSISKEIFGRYDDFSETVTPLKPIGEAKGIFPGRVVWVWNPNATNENCTNSFNGDGIADINDDGWFLDKNNDQLVIDEMLSSAIIKLTEKDSLADAWDSIFKYFNNKKHGISEGYTHNQKIFIKINSTSSWGYSESWGNITSNNDIVENEYYGNAETSPQIVLSLLRELITVCGIDQQNISVGDPMRDIYNHCYNKWYAEFPNVHYMSQHGGNGREKVIPDTSASIYYSDKGSQLLADSDTLYTVMLNADYLINIPQMKAHGLAGVTLFPKNHFGSHTRDNSQHLHPGLVATTNGVPIRTDSSLYRVQVDLMGHEKLGNNQLLFLLDALWAGSEATDPPTKWDLNPFNGDWTSSIFLSQDMVAIESVGYDFLAAEYDGTYDSNNVQKVNYPHMRGTTDYLRQAASSKYWPAGITYDPENDGSPIGSLGVNEHWNNKIDKQYSRNLGIGDGIELIFVNKTLKTVNSPSNLTAEIINDTNVKLSWIDNSENETGFIIERKDTTYNSSYQILDTINANLTNYIDTSRKDFSDYFYRIAAFNESLTSQYSEPILVQNITMVNVKSTNVNNKFTLNQNYPNPFNPTSKISFVIPEKTFVQLNVYDALGRKIIELVNGVKTPGKYTVQFDGTNLSSGIYFYSLTAGKYAETKKMMLMK